MSMDTPRVLAVDDDPSVLRIIELTLEGQGMELVTATSGREALEMTETYKPDAMLLDMMMPEMDGMQVLQEVREKHDMPIIFLTARDALTDKLLALNLGADDYMTKPFSTEEILARLRAVLRRRTSSGDRREKTVTCGNVNIDLNRRLVTKRGEPVQLTRTEWYLLQNLAANAGRTTSNAQILTSVWGSEYAGDISYLRVWISRLRQKLEDDPSNPAVIRTVLGLGYSILPDEEAPRDELK
jgi:DNA-binding response OmpR family regulator